MHPDDELDPDAQAHSGRLAALIREQIAGNGGALTIEKMVLDAKGKVVQRQVRTGLSDRLRVQIVDGLAEGDHLLIGAPAASGG